METFNVAAHGGPVTRNRGGLHYDRLSSAALPAAATTLRLFDDRRSGMGFIDGIDIASVREHLVREHPVWDTRGPASGFTRLSLPPLGGGKQLWLREGRAVVPSPLEILRLLEVSDDVYHEIARVGGDAAARATAELAGNGISMRMADELTFRATLRLRQIDSFLRHRDYLQARSTPDTSIEARLFGSAKPYVAHAAPTTFVVAVAVDAAGQILAFAPSDGIQLPTVRAVSDRTASRRTLACERAKAMMRDVTGLDSIEAILAHSDDHKLVVVVPVEFARISNAGTPAARWAPLRDMANTLTYAPIAHAISHIATYLRSAGTLGDSGRRGARPMRPLLPGAAVSQPADPASWATQIDFTRRADEQLRQAILHAPSPFAPGERENLFNWLPQIDSKHVADIPAHLRAPSSTYSAPELAQMPFPHQARIPTTPPISRKPPQVTAHKPTSVREILQERAITIIVGWIKASLDDMRAASAGREQRTARDTVLGQEYFIDAYCKKRLQNFGQII